MKKSIIIVMLFLPYLFCSISYTQIDNSVINIENSLMKIIEDDLNMKKKSSLATRYTNPRYDKENQCYVLGYIEYIPTYKYDIIKTNSIVAPYKGIVVYSKNFYIKLGKTRDECLQKPWETTHRRETYTYLYQNGNWVCSNFDLGPSLPGPEK